MRTLPIGDDRVGASTTGDEIVVRSPYDGHEIERVPACGRAEVDARGRDRGGGAPRRSAARRGSGPRSSTAPRGCSAERTEEFARIIAEEAAKPIKTARVEASRAVSTFTFAAAEARTLTGEMVPLDAADVGEGKLGFTLRVPVGVVGAISPFNFPLNLVAHKLAPAIAAGCPVVLKPASQTPLSAIALAELLLDECGLPAGQLNVVTGSGGTVGNAIVDAPRHRAHHVHRLARGRLGHPGAGAAQEGRARARQQRAGDHRARRRRRAPRPPRSRWPASATPGSRASRPSASTCTSRSPTRSSTRCVAAVDALVVGDPLDEATDVSALISRGRARPGRRRGSTRRSPPGPRSRPAATERRRRARARRCSPTCSPT